MSCEWHKVQAVLGRLVGRRARRVARDKTPTAQLQGGLNATRTPSRIGSVSLTTRSSNALAA